MLSILPTLDALQIVYWLAFLFTSSHPPTPPYIHSACLWSCTWTSYTTFFLSFRFVPPDLAPLFSSVLAHFNCIV
ncbi:hypothetical protein BDM02DRAFT_2964187 [Thelephora ganbajun]|uniref:Uncharacterized protein n=1 Tax=Thelephora ganbajun TaxID=370292 RepID=A0ACB6ZSM1_THEGA|nr:hypothetical protein BDM02DRAFT_2964187 [Thelephora ganbajun]